MKMKVLWPEVIIRMNYGCQCILTNQARHSFFKFSLLQFSLIKQKCLIYDILLHLNPASYNINSIELWVTPDYFLSSLDKKNNNPWFVDDNKISPKKWIFWAKWSNCDSIVVVIEDEMGGN